jgi:hypothetical protein
LCRTDFYKYVRPDNTEGIFVIYYEIKRIQNLNISGVKQMLNNELSRCNKPSANITIPHTTAEPLTFEEVAEMLKLSGDIARSLPIETLHKLWDCYIDMIGEVQERLGTLYDNLLIEFQGLHYGRREKIAYFGPVTSFNSDCFTEQYGIPAGDWDRYYAVN